MMMGSPGRTRSAMLARVRRAAALAALVTALPLAAQQVTEPLPGDYRVVAGRVDRGTYAGWRAFHSACHSCHDVGGVGTDLAPNLCCYALAR